MIGIFDSGLGGLNILRAILKNKKLSAYNYLYLGDNLRMPYGSRSPEAVFNFTLEAIKYLFGRGCQLIIVACNTSSALSLRKIQQKWLKKFFPQRRVLGVIRPTVEEVLEKKPEISRLGILATKGTVNSLSYLREFKKIKKEIKVYQQIAPLLVPIIEEGKEGLPCLKGLLKKYLQPLLRKKIESLVLACTHYSLVKKEIREVLPKRIKVFSQDEIIPKKLAIYLNNHPEIERKIGRQGKRIFLATDISFGLKKTAKDFFKEEIEIKLIKLQ